MEEFKNRLLNKYNEIIKELEEVENLCKATLEDATSKGDYSETDIAMLSAFGRDNYRRLQFAKAERDLLNK
jgi:hypothetical protein